MRDKGKILIIFTLILSFLMLTFLIFALFYIKYNSDYNQNSSNQNSDSNVVVKTVTEEPTIKNVLEKHESEYISQEDTTIYVKFGEDLYDENGKSNEIYFTDLIEDLKQFFENKSFELIDEEKDIDILIEYDSSTESYKIIFNNVENFYKETDGDDYVDVENVSIIEPSVLFVANRYLNKLLLNDMFFSSIEEYLTESKELEDGYISYPEEKLKVKLAPNGTVENIVFFEDYEGNILSNVTMGMSLKEILELHSDNSSGSLSDGYLGYRNGDYYYFFYSDEVSVYGCSYSKNDDFEELLEDYLEDKDLDKFVDDLKSEIQIYDEFEYDSDIKKLYMTFPTLGIEINIKDNDPKGITLYSNYYFTDYTKKLVKNGIISLNTKEDLVLKYESARRESD